MQQFISSYAHAQPNVYYDSKSGKFKHILAVSYGFELNNPESLVPINKLSMVLNKLLAEQNTGYDEGYDKPHPEYLVYANLPPVNEPKELTVTVGGKTKKIIQQPKRVWQKSGIGYIVEQVDSTDVVPLSYTKAYGSPEYAKNPTGQGYFGKKMSLELPMFEYKSNQVRTPVDKNIEPAGLSGKHVLCGSRKVHLGKYSKSEQKSMAATPCFPKAMDQKYFMMSSPDQWLDSLNAKTEYKLIGFGNGEIKGRLPKYKANIFTKDNSGTHKQHEGNVDTLVLLPTLGVGVVVTRFVFETNSITIADEYDTAMIQLNDLNDPHLYSDNVKSMDERELSPSTTGLRENDLLPISMQNEEENI
ncbi:hypothetical protein LO80_01585 [Candidatus Francisella endociliophora]|uniref:DUF2169 domain-containing protein n=1 Tax=Candidatus Francisella endociliophora TaxID=653937 RepID=A0A097EMJ6_9GAMM|nr:DUF2169 domain-containing protein [Francisella sp. FSC1006]AIT08794.1 hypothetical protein LO80_01585 [Francisella sp. FSC1006]